MKGGELFPAIEMFTGSRRETPGDGEVVDFLRNGVETPLLGGFLGALVELANIGMGSDERID